MTWNALAQEGLIIDIRRIGAGDPLEFEVVVRQGGSETTHRVERKAVSVIGRWRATACDGTRSTPFYYWFFFILPQRQQVAHVAQPPENAAEHRGDKPAAA
jgi:hypothetical protein